MNRKVKKSASLFFGLAFLGLSAFVYLISTNQMSVAYNTGYQPDQPIPFSHKLHVGEYGMDCRYCHTAVERGRQATVPSLNICMNCHLTVKVDSPHIQKMQAAYQNNQSIMWEKVHLMPDFVKFNHALHIKALTGFVEGDGSLPSSGEQVRAACTTCHGKVETMEVMYQKNSLSMGWCVECHRKEEHQAPVNCSTCHY